MSPLYRAFPGRRPSFFPAFPRASVGALTTSGRALAIGALLAGTAAGLPAQEGGLPTEIVLQEPGLASDVAASLVDFFNAASTVRLTGPAQVPERDTIRADLAVLGGPVVIAGRIEGSLLVVNGDLRLEPGASVDGGIVVVGGAFADPGSVPIGGEIVVHSGALRYRREGYRIVLDEESQPRGQGWGRSDFLVATGKSYNRVEGMPITFGPRIRTAGSNPLRGDALAIYRTESGLALDPDEMGYYARLEQYIGGFRALRVGVTVHSLVDPIEDWQISDLESGLSTFLFHRDFRDHYQRKGQSAFAIWNSASSPLELGLELRRETHRSLATGTPWSLTDNAEVWRPQPLVAEGRATLLEASAGFDTRSNPTDPSTGWFVRGSVEQALSSDLARPAAELREFGQPGPVPGLEPRPYGRFTAGAIDIRRYNRVDPTSRFNVRLLAAGALDGKSLPPQRQHAIGGEGSLPGYPLFHQDCGARSTQVYRDFSETASPYFARYGCDAFALFQAEYRGKFSFRFLWDSVPWGEDAEEDEDWGFVWDLSPDWTFFVDAGQAWSYGSGPDEKLAADVGIGILLNRFGVFVAVPVTGGDGVNLFARIGPRF